MHLFKSDLASELNIDAETIEIYQEDWSRALKLVKNDVSYFLAVSNCGQADDDETVFNACTEATRTKKTIFFNKTAIAEVELENFSEVITKLAEKHNLSLN